MTGNGRQLWNALIRTHHITSRKKVSKLKQAANGNDVYVLLRSGGCPGIMYVEGRQDGVEEWVATVQKLRYKDYQLASRPALAVTETGAGVGCASDRGGLHETETVKDFGNEMQQRGVYEWWRNAMGYSGQSDGIQ
ncbi:hypothetical protein K431DRAFT_343119 [Polychaeton citri CBS 116435]|uniref:Uncharacterized protein n=1 Tax=Polychaeton citri CBS 116435 TaxID=1314669 RepID=A0A9P4QHR9_9PEZI|nr:hypothetical protein K431DRAFT_343119 [Polychaeton citri CBS 116435]